MTATLKIDEITARFTQLLENADTSFDQPELVATWKAFAAFCAEDVQCDEERLFFEADLSSTVPDSFYVHFSRTFYGRAPYGHLWSHEVIGDFLFPLDDTLEEFNVSIEIEDIDDAQLRRDFVAQVENQTALWQALGALQLGKAELYVGES